MSSTRPPEARPFEVRGAGGAVLRGERVGEGGMVVQLHGLTATRRYVLHGSHALQRRGYEAVLYDARGHGESDGAPEGQGYGYPALAEDLGALLDEVGGERRVVLAGHSMGAHTAARYALEHPGRLAGIVAIGPASLGEPPEEEGLAYWDGLADGLEQGGVEGFLAAYGGDLDPDWREVLLRIARQRLELHSNPEAVAQALRDVPRSVPFEGLGALDAIEVPVLVVASHDDSDPGHPYAIAEAWTERLPRARLVSEDPGESPLAWSGGKLSREIAAFCEQDDVAAALEG